MSVPAAVIKHNHIAVTCAFLPASLLTLLVGSQVHSVGKLAGNHKSQPCEGHKWWSCNRCCNCHKCRLSSIQTVIITVGCCNSCKFTNWLYCTSPFSAPLSLRSLNELLSKFTCNLILYFWLSYCHGSDMTDIVWKVQCLKLDFISIDHNGIKLFYEPKSTSGHVK